jgi:hypothetical protein
VDRIENHISGKRTYLELAQFLLIGLNRRELALNVRFRAKTTSIEQTTLPYSDTTGGTWDGGYLFGRECTFLHFDRMRHH